MSDDIVAAHLAAALIQAGSQKLDAKTAATIYFDCLKAVRAESPQRGHWQVLKPATLLGLGHDCCRRNIKHGLPGGWRPDHRFPLLKGALERQPVRVIPFKGFLGSHSQAFISRECDLAHTSPPGSSLLPA
jgi:hypothetical protein